MEITAVHLLFPEAGGGKCSYLNCSAVEGCKNRIDWGDTQTCQREWSGERGYASESVLLICS